jgi:hypothetical protein
MYSVFIIKSDIDISRNASSNAQDDGKNNIERERDIPAKAEIQDDLG